MPLSVKGVFANIFSCQSCKYISDDNKELSQYSVFAGSSGIFDSNLIFKMGNMYCNIYNDYVSDCVYIRVNGVELLKLNPNEIDCSDIKKLKSKVAVYAVFAK